MTCARCHACFEKQGEHADESRQQRRSGSRLTQREREFCLQVDHPAEVDKTLVVRHGLDYYTPIEGFNTLLKWEYLPC